MSQEMENLIKRAIQAGAPSDAVYSFVRHLHDFDQQEATQILNRAVNLIEEAVPEVTEKYGLERVYRMAKVLIETLDVRLKRMPDVDIPQRLARLDGALDQMEAIVRGDPHPPSGMLGRLNL